MSLDNKPSEAEVIMRDYIQGLKDENESLTKTILEQKDEIDRLDKLDFKPALLKMCERAGRKLDNEMLDEIRTIMSEELSEKLGPAINESMKNDNDETDYPSLIRICAEAEDKAKFEKKRTYCPKHPDCLISDGTLLGQYLCVSCHEIDMERKVVLEKGSEEIRAAIDLGKRMLSDGPDSVKSRYYKPHYVSREQMEDVITGSPVTLEITKGLDNVLLILKPGEDS